MGRPSTLYIEYLTTNITNHVKDTNHTPPEASSDSTRCGQNDSQRPRQQERVRKEDEERERGSI